LKFNNNCSLDTTRVKLSLTVNVGHDDAINLWYTLFSGYHPAVHVRLLFNSILKHMYVPRTFYHAIIISLLKIIHGDASKIEMYAYRGITCSGYSCNSCSVHSS